MDSFYLNKPYEQLKTETAEIVDAAQMLEKDRVTTARELEEFVSKYETWKSSAVSLLQTSFNIAKNPIWVMYHNQTRDRGFHIDGATEKPFSQKVSDLKNKIRSDIYWLNYIVRLVGACDLIINPDKDFSERENMTFTQRVEFVLDKLYALYDDNHYPVKEILQWNNIHPKTSHEDRDIVQFLEDRGLVESISYRTARLTSEARITMETQEPEKKAESGTKRQMTKKIFIVHGHDHVAKLELKDFLLKKGYEPIILDQVANEGLETIAKKLHRLLKECSCAIALLTPDDKTGDSYRARQNVIYELGFFVGISEKLEDCRIAILKKGDVEIPSDLNGVLYYEFYKSVTEKFYQLGEQLDAWYR